MARTAITVQTLGLAMVTPTYGAADQANGNYFVHPGGTVLLHVKNTNGATRTLTLKATDNKVGGFAVTDQSYIIPLTTGDKMICNLGSSSVQSNGQVYLDWSADTGVTIGVFALPG
jgi:hypothetical protein